MLVGTVLFCGLENLPDCHSRYTAATPTLVLMTKHVFRHYQMSSNGVCLMGTGGITSGREPLFKNAGLILQMTFKVLEAKG